MKHLTVFPLPIEGVCRIERALLGDSRGWLQRVFCEQELKPILRERRIEQVNRTLTTRRGTVRGMHFQFSPSAETKIITCTSGRVFDVALDLRQGSPTFLNWHAEFLDANEPRSLIIPEGCAHGFQTLTDNCEMLYLHTAAYSAEHESGVCPTDPTIEISWPEQITEISERDRKHPLLSPEFNGITL